MDPECLHYSQETEHERVLQGTIKEVRGQPWVNTFRGATWWRHGDLSPQDGKCSSTVNTEHQDSSSVCLCVFCTLWWRETEPLTLSIHHWQQVRLTHCWGEAGTVRCTVCLCSQVTKVKHNRSSAGSVYGCQWDLDVTEAWRIGFSCQRKEWNGKKRRAWAVGARDCGHTAQHPSLVVQLWQTLLCWCCFSAPTALRYR